MLIDILKIKFSFLKPVYYVYNSLVRKIIRIIFYPLHLGTSDYYPAYSSIKDKIFFSKLLKINDQERMNFWGNLCKKHPTFKFFYQNKPEVSFLESNNILKNYKHNEPLVDFYKNGVGIVKNFFQPNDHKIIKNFFYKNVEPQLVDKKNASLVCKDVIINRLLHNEIKQIERTIFNKDIKIQKYRFSIWKKEKKKNTMYKDSVNFHRDRFIPTIKLIYFPEDVKVDPFEYCLKSHIINTNFINDVKINFKYNDPKKNSLHYKTDIYEKKKFFVKSNSLLIAATHGLHRRSQSDELDLQGMRKYITISYYNSFTRLDLLKLFFK